MKMTREIYEALKKRIRIITPFEVYKKIGRKIFDGSRFIYFFSNDGLNPGLKRDDIEYIDSIIHPMSTHNMWNVCQRFYSFIQGYEDIDKRLLV